jgi:hypothetical protein
MDWMRSCAGDHLVLIDIDLDHPHLATGGH